MEGDDQKKPHRVSKTGRKAEKKQRKNQKDEKVGTIDPRIRNPKAFAINNAQRAERRFRRKQDLQTNKERAPLVDRTPVEPPPFIVAFVGPPKVGKSTLMQNLIKNYTRQTLSESKGPITIISGKKRRLTFIECNNDINSMIDVAKVADLVLLIIDASFGFEMEVFEFLNICQVHGFPQIMGVLTHLDLFKNKTQLKKTKKTLKHRFWTEVYPGSKLFYLSGYHAFTNSYPKNEIHNLARFISVMKFRPTNWRTEHAFVVADRMEDLTSLESIRVDNKVDRTVSLYGFVHGTHLKPNVSVHIPGVGDFTPDNVIALEDPCPLPQKEQVLRRSLNEKEKLIYAPFSGVGGIVYDHDAVYIDLGGSHSHGKRRRDDNTEEEESTPMVKELREMKSTLNEKLESAGLQLFSTSDVITSGEVVDSDEEDSDDDEDDEDEGFPDSGDEGVEKFGLTEGVDVDDDDDDEALSSEEDEEEEEGSEGENEIDDDDAKSARDLKKKRYEEAKDLFYSRFRNRPIQKMIYDDVDDFYNLQSHANFDLANCTVQDVDNSIFNEEDDQQLKDLFVGGDYAETAANLLEQDEEDALGDFEELDNDNEDDQGDENMDYNEVDGDGNAGQEGSSKSKKKQTENKKEDSAKTQKLDEMKKKLKEKFDLEYDEGGDADKSFYTDWKSQVEEQAQLNRTFFDNIEDPNLLQDLQGFAPGTYVRVQISHVPYEFVENFSPQRTAPLIIGSLDTPNQETLSVIQARIKKHRWYPKILKTRDPIILSVGWRRFQTIALYSVHDHNMRNRMIKYTTEHLHCIANFFGPVTPQGTGIIGFAPQGTEGFRITLTGTILDMNKSTELVKKLKLIGNPVKIFKKSAFVEGMFNSQLEVTRFIGAKIKSVSGIRGVVKKPLRTPAGAFRAAFEDKIQASDIIFCRTWAKVEIPKFFMSLPTHIIQQPRLVKTMGQLKFENQIKIMPNPDNLYTPIERTEKKFRPLKVPKRLQDKLPYKDKPKIQAKLQEPRRIAVIKEPHERIMAQSLKLMRSALAEKEAKAKMEKEKKFAERNKIIKKQEERQNQRQKVLRKKVFRTLGLINKKKDTNFTSKKK